MTRPTSLCRSRSLKVVILPLGISVSTVSSGNSTNWRITNSRNSLMTKKVTTNEHESTRISAWNQKRRRLTQTLYALGGQRPPLPLISVTDLTLRRFPGCRFCDGSRGCRFRGRRWCRRLGRSFRGSAGHLFFIFLNQTANGVGRLRAFADPVFGPIQFQRAVVIGFFRIVRADDLDKFSITWAAAVGHHHFVIGAILRSFPA